MSGDHGHHAPTNFWQKYVFSTDHKVIGLQFTFTSLLFVILGALLALGVRYQLAWPNQNVPYASILPGKMTSKAPEANPALWKTMLGQTAKVQTESGEQTGKLLGFDQDRLAVTLPRGLRLEMTAGEGGKVETLDDPTPAYISVSSVMGDYDYAKQNALTSVGEVVDLGDGRTAVIKGLEILLPSSSGAPTPRIKTDPVALPIRTDATFVNIEGLAQPVAASRVMIEKDALTTDAYLQLFTMHASIMIFFVIIPMLVGGFGNFLIPLMVGARDMAFPKLNMLSFWLSFPAGIIMIFSFWVMHGPAGGGWTMYPTLSTPGYLKPEWGTTLWVVSVGLVGFSSVVGALNYITTIINMRAPGMSMFRMPLTVWSLFITSILAVFATPVLTAAMVMLAFDRLLGTTFFIPEGGGQVLLWQHLFWFYSHPAVYIMILPAMGVTSDVLAVHARKPIFGYKPMVFAMAAITGLGYIVWGHHMFQSGMNPVLGTTFMASTIMIAVPSAIKTFNWLGTLWGGNIRFTPAMLWALGFVSMFVIGGLSGIFMASAPVDIHIHDTYFIVAHIHYVLFGGSIMGIFAGIYHWYPKMFGRQMDQRWGTIHFILTLIALNGTFFLMHVLGIGGHPRRYASIMEYPTLMHLQPMNVIMTMWAMALGMAQIPFFLNFFASLPRPLGRGMVAAFAIALGLPTFAGLTYWNTFADAQSWIGQLCYAVVGQTDAGGFTTFQNVLGYLLLLGVSCALLCSMFRRLPGICKAFVVGCGGLYLLSILYVAKLHFSGSFQAETLSTYLGWMSIFDRLMVAVGLGMLYVAVAWALVYAVWAVGGMLKMPCILSKLLYVLILPMYLSPMILKQDLFVMRGHPELWDHRWLLLALLALPGLAYVLIRRPADTFGVVPSDNPWEANSLEWETTSPPIFTNFEHIPTVYRGPYEFGSPVVEKDYLPQVEKLPAGVIEPAGH